MSLQNGLSALNLEMPDKIPRTEYSAHFHWDLVQKVTGIPVSSKSTVSEQTNASREFIKAWDYGLFWNIFPYGAIFGEQKTKMGHASYQADAVDYSNEVKNFIEEPEDVFDFDFDKVYGRRNSQDLLQDFQDDYDKMCLEHPDTVNMTGMYTTCMSGIIEILGWDMLLLAAGVDSHEFGAFINRYVNWNLQYFEALAKCKSDVIMVHDDIVWGSGAFLSPDFYRTYIFPNHKKLLAPLLDSGKKVLFTSDGNFTQFIDDIADLGIHGFVMEPCTDMSYICEKYGKSHVIVGNADTHALLYNDKEYIENEVKRCIALGRDCPGYFLAVGNHIPPNTPVEACLWYQEFYEKYSRR